MIDCLLHNRDYSIYALADNIEQAKKIAIHKASELNKSYVREVVFNTIPIVYNEADSFIKTIGKQLI